MQLGFVSAILPELNFTEVMTLASDIGYDCVEIMSWPKGKVERRYAGVTHIDVNDINHDYIKSTINNTGVAISALGYYPNPLSPDNTEASSAVDHIKKLIKACVVLGLNLNTFVGRDWRKSIEDNWPLFLETWIPIIKYAEENDVKVGIENCPMLFTKDEWPGGKNLATSPAIWTQMFNDIPSGHFGLNFDPSHFVLQHMDYLSAMRNFKDKLFHIHAKDVRIDHHKLNEVGILGYPNQFHTPKLPGMGDVDWGKFFSILTDTGYQGPVCVEVEDRAFEGDLNLRIQSLKRSYNYLRQFIPKS